MKGEKLQRWTKRGACLKIQVWFILNVTVAETEGFVEYKRDCLWFKPLCLTWVVQDHERSCKSFLCWLFCLLKICNNITYVLSLGGHLSPFSISVALTGSSIVCHLQILQGFSQTIFITTSVRAWPYRLTTGCICWPYKLQTTTSQPPKQICTREKLFL